MERKVHSKKEVKFGCHHGCKTISRIGFKLCIKTRYKQGQKRVLNCK